MKSVPHVSGIYEIRNLLNSKVYIGSAVDTHERCLTHRKALRRGKHANTHLQGAWKAYGESAFSFALLETVENRADLVSREQHWIDSRRAAEPEHGYNLRPVAGSNLGLKASPETRARLSAARKGNKYALGTKQSPETIAKRLKAKAGKKPAPRSTPYSEQELKARSERMIGNTYAKGAFRSETWKKQVSETLLKVKQRKVYEGFVSPDGKELDPIINLPQFCRDHGLSRGTMQSVYDGKRISHKGWTVKKTPEG